MSEITLTLFRCGHLRFANPAPVAADGSDRDLLIPIPWYFVTHPQGNIVIDGGNALGAARDPRGHWGPVADSFFPVMTEADFCVNALAAQGHDPASVRWVIQSHLHHDHSGAIGAFPNATHVVRRKEYDYAFAPDWFTAQAYCRRDFDQPGLAWEFLDDTAEIDFFGDGSVLLVSTPGHAVGHQSVLVNLPDSGPMLLAIDAVMFLDHWNRKGLPGLATSMVEAVRSMDRLRAIVARRGARLVPGHDAAALADFRFAPDSYT